MRVGAKIRSVQRGGAPLYGMRVELWFERAIDYVKFSTIQRACDSDAYVSLEINEDRIEAAWLRKRATDQENELKRLRAEVERLGGKP